MLAGSILVMQATAHHPHETWFGKRLKVDYLKGAFGSLLNHYAALSYW